MSKATATPEPNSKSNPKPELDPLAVQRGDYGRNYLPTAIFVLGRLASGPIQYAVLQAHPLGRLGVPPPPTGGFIHIRGHTFAKLPLLAALMPTVLGSKHALWQLAYCRERMTIPFAAFGAIADIVYELVSTLVFSAARSNPLWSERLFYVGSTIYYSAIALELIAELHRVYFKSRPENERKLCTTGLWSVTRHINYTANVVFGFGYGLATGGPLYSIPTAGMYLANFITNAMPSIEEYCRSKYGAQWTQYTKRVPWQLIPGIY